MQPNLCVVEPVKIMQKRKEMHLCLLLEKQRSNETDQTSQKFEGKNRNTNLL